MGNSPTQEQKDTNLSVAAERGEVVKVDKLLKDGADPNKALKDGERLKRTSLHRAAKTKNNVDVLTKLLTCIKDVDATDDEGNTALHLAAGYYNNAAVVQTLLHANPNCRVQNSRGQTALHSAVERGSDWKVIENLLMANTDPNIADFDGNTALHLCAGKRLSDDIVPGMLLRFGANPNIKNNEGQTSLHLAAHAGNKVVLLLLKFNAKVRLRDKEGRKPADLAEVEEIKRILEFEERMLEERTIRSDYGSVFESQPGRSPNTYGTNGYDSYRNYPSNGVVSPNGRSTHFWAGDIGKWKAFGGEGIIQLPDKSEIIVPPQAVPKGTSIKLSIKPRDRSDENEIPEFDFGLYDISLDVKVDLPGTVLISEKDHTSVTSSPAFTGFCADGRNRWFSSREVACQRNGITALQFNLQRRKGETMAYKIPMENQRSSTEVYMKTPKGLNQENNLNFSQMNGGHQEDLNSSLSSSENNDPIESFNQTDSRYSRHSQSSSSSSATEEEFESFKLNNESSNFNKDVPKVDLFDDIEVVVELPGNKKEKTPLHTDASKVSAVDAISEYLGEQVDSSDSDSSSSSGKKRGSRSIEEQPPNLFEEPQIDITDAKQQFSGYFASPNQNDVENVLTHEKPLLMEEKEERRQSVSDDSQDESRVSSNSSSSDTSDDNDDDKKKDNSVLEYDTNKEPIALTTNNQANEIVKDLSNKEPERVSKGGLLDKIAYYENLNSGKKRDSSSSSSSDSSSDALEESSPLPTNELVNIGFEANSQQDTKSNSTQSMETESQEKDETKLPRNTEIFIDNLLDSAMDINAISTKEKSAESSDRSSDSRDSDDFVILKKTKDVESWSPKMSPRRVSSSSSSNDEEQEDVVVKDKQTIEVLVSKDTEELKTKDDFHVDEGSRSDDKENKMKLEVDLVDNLSTTTIHSESETSVSSDSDDSDDKRKEKSIEFDDNDADQIYDNDDKPEDYLHGRDCLAENDEVKTSTVEDLDDVHKLLILQENSSFEERYQHPIDPALATIDERAEELNLTSRKRHGSSSSSCSTNSSHHSMKHEVLI